MPSEKADPAPPATDDKQGCKEDTPLPLDHETSHTPILVNADKAYEIEANVAKDEIRNRMEYNRRILNVQATIVSAAVGAVVVLQGKPEVVSPLILQAALLGLIWISLAFSLENASNNIHISMAAHFMSTFLNKKYSVVSADQKSDIYEWEKFLSSIESFSGRRPFLLTMDAPLVINLLLVLFCCVEYLTIGLANTSDIAPSYASLFLVGLFLTFQSYRTHFNSASILKTMIQQADLERFKQHYRI